MYSLCTLAIEDLGTFAEYDPLTGYEPNDYHITEATEPYIQESSVENGSLNDYEYDDVTIGKALSSPLFTQEREDDASRRRAYHSLDEGLSSSQSSSVGHVTTGRPVSDQFDSVLISNVRENPRRDSENEQPHQDHITAKGMNSITHYSLVHKSIPMPQAFKNPDAKAAVEKEWRKPTWQLTKVRNKNEVIAEAKQ